MVYLHFIKNMIIAFQPHYVSFKWAHMKVEFLQYFYK